MDFLSKPPAIATWKWNFLDFLTRMIVDDDRYRAWWIRLTRLFMFFFWPTLDYRHVYACNRGYGCGYVSRNAHDCCMLHAALTVY